MTHELEERISHLEHAGARDAFLIGKLTQRLLKLEREVRGEKVEDEGGVPATLEAMMDVILNNMQGRLFE